MIAYNSSIARPELPILHRVFRVDNLDDNGLEFAFDLDVEERQNLCRYLDLQAIENWEAKAWLLPTVDLEGVVLKVTFAANVIQSCVVTLEPVHNRVQHSFTNRYLPNNKFEAIDEEEVAEFVIDVDGEDFPEVMQEDGVDVGEAIAEQFALALDPYPKSPGVCFGVGVDKGRGAEEYGIKGDNPFAALKSWKSGS